MKNSMLLLFALVPILLFSNNPSELRGKIMDEETKEPLSFAKVIVTQNGVQKGAAITNEDGQYKIGLKPGKYDVSATYIGYDRG